jgi:hypothetical protein
MTFPESLFAFMVATTRAQFHDRREVMPSVSNDAMHLRRDDCPLLPGASVEAGAQHPAENTAITVTLRALVRTGDV